METKAATGALVLEPHFTASNTVRDIIIGMSDGLTVPFALAAGLSGAVSQSNIIVIAGLAEIAAGCISMGLGGYLAAQNDSEHYYSEQKREYKEVEVVPEIEAKEVIDIFKTYGLNDAHIEPIIADFKKNPDNWVAFMMQNELHLDKPDKARAKKSGLTIALSYLFAGFIPLSPYIFIKNTHSALLVSVAVTLLALLIFGYIKAKLIGNNPWKSALQTILIGGVAAGAAYLIAKWIAR
jgi:VIT1/CCC1 family predicted Fe2+/Mn2+ transporter